MKSIAAFYRDLFSRGRGYYLLALLPLVVLLGFSFFFQHFVLDAINKNIVLNAIILGTMFFGAAMILLRLHDVQSEYTYFKTALFAVDSKTKIKPLPERDRSTRRILDHLIVLGRSQTSSPGDQAKLASE